MKLILVTGLDGSGKSTLLDKLDKFSEGKRIAFIRVPKIDSDLFKENETIHKTTLFVNQMHQGADQLKMPQLKVIALFSSMLIFKELVNELDKKHINLVFCERHPLIDTGVYAKFYDGKMDPLSLPQEVVNNLNEQYSVEIAYLLDLLKLKPQQTSLISCYLQFIHNWFSIDQKHDIMELRTLFNIDLPDKIIYLSASPEILMERLQSRKILEAHESIDVFKKLIPVYEAVLDKTNTITDKIDACTFLNLDFAFEKIKRTYF